jgi:serine/threonine protein kinase
MRLLESEIRILRLLDHPHIIKCLDVYKTPSQFYIITEYCQKGDLATFMTQRGPLGQT